jgi:hypothetical protein
VFQWFHISLFCLKFFFEVQASHFLRLSVHAPSQQTFPSKKYLSGRIMASHHRVACSTIRQRTQTSYHAAKCSSPASAYTTANDSDRPITLDTTRVAWVGISWASPRPVTSSPGAGYTLIVFTRTASKPRAPSSAASATVIKLIWHNINLIIAKQGSYDK